MTQEHGPEQGDHAEEVDVVGLLVDDPRGGEGGYRIEQHR